MTFSYSLNDSEHPAIDYLANQLNAGKRIILLTGELGAGKTTFVKHFLNSYLKELIEVDSPTFSIVNTYESEGRLFHHFDLYRLDSLEEIEDIGCMEYLESGNLCFIEWPEKIAEFLPADQVIHLSISVSSPQCREYHFS